MTASTLSSLPAAHSPLPMTIRPMQLEDLPQVIALDQLCFTLPWPPSSYRFELLENQAARCWVAATNEDQIVGVLVMWFIVDEAHIATIAAHPNVRRQGIGRALLLTGLHQAVEQNMLTATLEVRAQNEAAIRLYEQFGFEVVGRRKRYYHDNGEDALLMTASLTSQKR